MSTVSVPRNARVAAGLAYIATALTIGIDAAYPVGIVTTPSLGCEKQDSKQSRSKHEHTLSE